MISAVELSSFQSDFARLAAGISEEVVGKNDQVELALICLLSGGHLLIEDVPGVAKTTLAKALAHSIGGDFARIQFTADLLPSDVTGVQIFDQRNHTFAFEKGSVFANVLLGDEINRASPKTQAALLEVMAEKQVTVGRTSHPVPDPFVCIATQNPVEFYGTYSLPEAQLDRFAIRLTLGYPTVGQETKLILQRIGEGAARTPVSTGGRLATDAIVHLDRVRAMTALARRIHLAPAIGGYIAEIAEATRWPLGRRYGIRLGVSPRGSLALASCALVLAASRGETFVTDEHVQEIAVPVLAHRLILDDPGEANTGTQIAVMEKVLAAVDVPRSRSFSA